MDRKIYRLDDIRICQTILIFLKSIIRKRLHFKIKYLNKNILISDYLSCPCIIIKYTPFIDELNLLILHNTSYVTFVNLGP